MLSVYQLPVPTPYSVGAVNIYLIKSEPYTLIDAGPDMDKSRRVLEEGLKALSVNLSDIKRVIITHSHSDHSGLASWINKKSGARVYIHPYELRRMSVDSDHIRERLPFVIEAGLPAREIDSVMGTVDKLPQPVLDKERANLLFGSETLSFESGELKVIHLPGHAPGHLCLYAPSGGHLFAGDFLLSHITPNPFLEPDPDNPGCRLPSLQQYIDGLDILENMKVKVVWPGHGGVFNDYRSVIEAGREHHRKQWKRIKDVVNSRVCSCYQISKQIYPRLRGWQVFMGISEIQAHLDYLVQKGELIGELNDGVMYYQRSER